MIPLGFVFRYFLFIFVIGLVVWGIVWLVSYFVGGKAYVGVSKLKKKMTDDIIDADEKVKKEYSKDKRYKKKGRGKGRL